MRWLAAVALGVFMAMACTGGSVQSATRISPSPTSPLSPPLTQKTPVLSSTPPCTAGQLEARLFGEFGYAGHMDTPIVFRNRGAAPCSIEGFPDLTILDAGDHVIAQATGSGQRATFFGEPPAVAVVLETDTPPLTTTQGIRKALPRGQTLVHIEWYDCRAPVAARMKIDLPIGGGQLKIDYAITAPYSAVCDNPAAGFPAMALGRGPFTPT